MSDTHGRLSDDLLERLRGADAIVHAGDLCFAPDYDTLSTIAPTFMCLGNNDWSFEYDGRFEKHARMLLAGMRWEVCHYRERLDLSGCDIAICGHTHRPFIEESASGVLIMNPGSPTYPRGSIGPTFGRIVICGGIESVSIEELPTHEDVHRWHF